MGYNPRGVNKDSPVLLDMFNGSLALVGVWKALRALAVVSVMGKCGAVIVVVMDHTICGGPAGISIASFLGRWGLECEVAGGSFIAAVAVAVAVDVR